MPRLRSGGRLRRSGQPRRCGNHVVGCASLRQRRRWGRPGCPLVSAPWSRQPRDHMVSVASMTNRRTAGVVAQLARPRLAGSRCPTIRTAGRGGRIPAGGARVTLAIMPQSGPVPRDRVTPPRCGRGRVTPSFSCRSAGGGDGTGSSTGHTGHRSTTDSMVRRRAELARPPLPGCRRIVCAVAAAMPAHAVVPQAPVVRQCPITVEDPAYVVDPGSYSYQNTPHKLYPPP
jgi:hypothetical protein